MERLNRPWNQPVKLHELNRGPLRLHVEPDADERAAIAKRLRLRSLPSFTADVTVKSWMDGVEIAGGFKAVVEQVCGVSLDPFEQPVQGEILVQAVPAGSPQAPPAAGGDLELDTEAPDAPDLLRGDLVDLAAYLEEHLALELDPFPRKPGATFDYQAPEGETSPFAALKKLQEPKA